MKPPDLPADVLPFLGASRRDLRHRIISVLAEKWPLKAKQVYKLVERGSPGITYQGVHKALKQLVEEGAVSEREEGYELSMGWVQGLKEALAHVSSAYAGTDKMKADKLMGEGKISSRPFSLLEMMASKKLIVWEQDMLFLFGNRVHLLPTNTVMHFTKILHEKECEWIFYQTSRKTGFEWVDGVQKKTGMRSINELTAHAGDILSFGGWGSLDITHMETNPAKVVFAVENSPVAREYVKRYGIADYPVDIFLSGGLAGGFSIPFQEPTLEFIETKCLAKGDRHCEFLGMPRAHFNLKDKSIARQIGSDADVKRMERELAKR